MGPYMYARTVHGTEPSAAWAGVVVEQEHIIDPRSRTLAGTVVLVLSARMLTRRARRGGRGISQEHASHFTGSLGGMLSIAQEHTMLGEGAYLRNRAHPM